MSLLLTILSTVIIFGIVIFIHEFGHFLCAKLCHVQVNEFALGMGPKIFSFTKGETKYSLRLLPIGGYCQMEGEDGESENPRAFPNRPIWQRILIVSAGALMNLILGFLVVCLTICLYSRAISSTKIAQFSENAKTQQTGLQVDDTILKINNRRIHIDSDIVFELQRDDDLIVDMEVLRGGQKVTLHGVTFDYTVKHDEKTDTDYKSFVVDFKVYGIQKSFFSVLRQSFYESIVIGKSIWVSLVDLVRNFQLNKISGFVGVGEVIGEAAGMGFDYLLNILAFITINLGIFNLLPIPALDGGRLLFLLIQLIIRRPIPAKYEGMIHAIGFIALILLMIIVTFKDLWMLIVR